MRLKYCLSAVILLCVQAEPSYCRSSYNSIIVIALSCRISGVTILINASCSIAHAGHALPACLCLLPCDADLDGIGHEVTGHVSNLITAVVLPVLIPNSVQLSHALSGLRPFIQLPALHGMLLPAVEPESMHLQANMTCILPAVVW